MYTVNETGQVIEHKGRTFRDKIDYSLFPVRNCVKCSKSILTKDTANIKVTGKNISVTCRLDYNEYPSIVCWDCRPPHSMNANSVKYNMLKFGLTEEDALALIHSRNKSPFYRHNHIDHEEYRKFQAHDSFSDEQKQEIQVKQDLGRKHWAEKLGKDKVRELKDSSSLKFHVKKYGSELGKIKFNEKNKNTRGKRIKDIKTKEQMQQHLLSQYKISSSGDLKIWFNYKIENKSIISILFLIENNTLTKHTIPIQFGKTVFSISDIYDFLGVKYLKEFIEKRVRPNKRGYTYNAVVDGNFLRSGKEITFYRLLEENGIAIIDTNKSYPNTGRNFYDFCIDILGKRYYIEIIGSSDLKYKHKLLEREKNHGAILIEQKYYKKFFADINSGTIEKGTYHDW